MPAHANDRGTRPHLRGGKTLAEIRSAIARLEEQQRADPRDEARARALKRLNWLEKSRKSRLRRAIERATQFITLAQAELDGKDVQ